MRRRITFFLAFLLACAVSAQTQRKSNSVDGSDQNAEGEWGDSGGADSYAPGDVNGDEKVTIADLVLLISYLKGDRPANFNADAADVADSAGKRGTDGKVTLFDVRILADMITKKQK